MRRSVSAAPAVAVAAAPAVIAGARGVVHAGSKGCSNHHGGHIVTGRIHGLHRLGGVVATAVVVVVLVDHGRRHGCGGVRGLGRLVGAVVAVAAIGRAVGGGLHAQRDPVPGRRGGARRVVAACVLVDHVIGHGTVLVVGLGSAVAHRLVLGLARGLGLVAQHGAADHAGRRGGRPSAAMADGIADHAARQGTQNGARARGALAGIDVFIAADLLWHGHLLGHRGHRQHPALLLGQGHGGGRGRQRQKNQGFHDCTPVALAVFPARLHASVFLGPGKQFAVA